MEAERTRPCYNGDTNYRLNDCCPKERLKGALFIIKTALLEGNVLPCYFLEKKKYLYGTTETSSQVTVSLVRATKSTQQTEVLLNMHGEMPALIEAVMEKQPLPFTFHFYTKAFRLNDIETQGKNELFLLDLPIKEHKFTRNILPLLHLEDDKMEMPHVYRISKFFRKCRVPASLRQDLWKSRIGNKLRITKIFFDNLVQRLDLHGIPLKEQKIIVADLDRTFPDVESEADSHKLYQDLLQLLSLFQVYRPDIGYVQGMSSLILTLCLVFDKFDAFVAFCNLILCDSFFNDMYCLRMHKVAFGYLRYRRTVLSSKSSWPKNAPTSCRTSLRSECPRKPSPTSGSSRCTAERSTREWYWPSGTACSV